MSFHVGKYTSPMDLMGMWSPTNQSIEAASWLIAMFFYHGPKSVVQKTAKANHRWDVQNPS